MKVLIIEDEKPACRLICDMVNNMRPDWEIVNTLDSIKSSVEWLNSNSQPDLIFLDIHLTDGSGFDIFNEVNTKCPVIFTTAYDEYALKAFSLNSIDYILKPIKEDNLRSAIDKFDSLRNTNSIIKIDYQKLSAIIDKSEKKYRSRFLVACTGGFVKINTEDIALIYSQNKISTALCFDGKHYVLDSNLEVIENELDPSKFIRANRQIIINVDSVNKVENYFNGKLLVKTIPEFEEQITVSREKAKQFKTWLNC